MRKLWIAAGLLVGPLAALAGCGKAGLAETAADEKPVDAGPKESLPPDLRTRKTGDDWPGFLGPNGDSTSREQGILTKWPAAGPPLVWQRPVGSGYAMPSISRGRLFLFDRSR